MGDGQVVLNALGSSGKPLETQIRLVYPEDTEPVSAEGSTIDLYRSMVEMWRSRAYSSLSVGELKVFFKEHRPDFTPHQAINRLEKLGLLMHVGGKKSSRSDPPLRSVVLRPVCEFRAETKIFIPSECLGVQEPIVEPQANPLAEAVAEVLESSPTVVKAPRISTKDELKQDLESVIRESALLENQWKTQREELQNAAIATENEITQLEARLEQLRETYEMQNSAHEAHLETRPDGLKELSHKRAALEQAIRLYDDIAPFLLRS